MVDKNKKTTYVLGAGASLEAGYPLCSALWAKMAMWVIESQPCDSEYRRAIDTVTAIHGPVLDVEGMFTNLDLGTSAFQMLTEGQRNKLTGIIQRCLRDYFKSICDQHSASPLYKAFADRIQHGDDIITFNYDVSLENALIETHKFGVKNGYGTGFVADWDEADSDVRVLKLHGSINWMGETFAGIRPGSFAAFTNSLGGRPFVDNRDALFPRYPTQVLDSRIPIGGDAGTSRTLILPTYHKKYSVATSVGDEWSPFFESLWFQASEAVEQADCIVIVGYSMPEADHRARTLLLWGANKRIEVLLCCAGSNGALKRSFETHGFCRVVEVGIFADLLA
jgi:hypothetical protein